MVRSSLTSEVAPLRIGLFHGYELTGSGSNEFTRYLARALAAAGHEVHVACREPHPESAAVGADVALRWRRDGSSEVVLAGSGGPGTVTVHSLPHADVRPVYVTDKQREGNVKAFTDLSDAELADVTDTAVDALRAVFAAYPVDVVLANHLVLQPTIAIAALAEAGVPVVIYPHGSDIEYTIRPDARYRRLAGEALASADGLITGSQEMFTRITTLYPQLADRLAERWQIVGVGVDVSLFSPIARAERRAAIEELADTRPGGGKTPEQKNALRAQVTAGRWSQALAQGRDYARELPDADSADVLTGLPWETGRMVLFVGALTVGKGLQSVIAAFPAVLREVPDAYLVIVGSGTYREVLEVFVDAIADGDEATIDEMVAAGFDLDDTHQSGPWADVAAYLADPEQRAVVASAGARFAEHVRFVGRLDHSRLNLLFPSADLAVFPSVLPEAYPLVLMESAASGVVPCASDLTGLGEGLDLLEPHLGREVTDRLRLPMADEDRVAAIAANLVSLLRNPDNAGYAARLREVAVAEYDWSVRAAQMAAALAGVVRGSAGETVG